MSKIYYHVVTDKPMKLNQVIVFDDNHHSGVYKRVYELKDKVDEIYQNPDAYKNIELDHHLKVALRELAMEEVRKEKYPNYPSRLSSLYVSNTLEEALNWYNLFQEWGRPTYSIVKVEVDGNVYVGDSWNCFDGTTDKKRNLELAENYWKYPTNQEGKEPIVEILADGNIKVVEIIKENNYVCKIATLEDIIKKYDYEIEKSINDKDNWIVWKDKAIKRFNDGLTTTYMGLLNDEIICECTATTDPSIVQNAEGLIDDKSIYLFAFRTNEEYQGQGFFSKLFKYMINDLISKGYEIATLGVEPQEEKNKIIYNKYGFTEHIKDAKEIYPDGTIVDVEYYARKLK